MRKPVVISLVSFLLGASADGFTSGGDENRSGRWQLASADDGDDGDEPPRRKKKRSSEASRERVEQDDSPSSETAQEDSDDGARLKKKKKRSRGHRSDESSTPPAAAQRDSDEEDGARSEEKAKKKKKKKKKKTRAAEDDENAEDGHGKRSRSLGRYLGFGAKALIPFAMLTDDPMHKKVQNGAFMMGWLAPIATPVGGYLWLPRLLYGTPPDNEAGSRTTHLGLMATALWWAPLCLMPFFCVPIIGWTAGACVAVFQARFQHVMMQRAVNLAFSDSFIDDE